MLRKSGPGAAVQHIEYMRNSMPDKAKHVYYLSGLTVASDPTWVRKQRRRFQMGPILKGNSLFSFFIWQNIQ